MPMVLYLSTASKEGSTTTDTVEIKWSLGLAPRFWLHVGAHTHAHIPIHTCTSVFTTSTPTTTHVCTCVYMATNTHKIEFTLISAFVLHVNKVGTPTRRVLALTG